MTDEIERGRLAQQVRDNPVFAEAMAQIQDEVISKWQNETDPKDREWLWSMNQACKRLEQVLTQTMQAGAFKSSQIERDRSRSERIGRALRGH